MTNELALSMNLTTITTEIRSYQSIGGHAIFEIGKRLKWVKENDLAHGDFGKWLIGIRFDDRTARRFMTIAERLDESATSPNLSTEVMYLMAQLPEDERQQPQQLASGDVKTPAEMTVRELREVKQQLKAKDDEIKRLQQQPPKVETVAPPDYKTLQRQVESLRKRNEYLESEQEDLIQQRDQYSVESDEYRQLQEKIQKMSAKSSGVERHLLAATDVLKLKNKADELLDLISPAMYSMDFQEFKPSDPAIKTLNQVVSRVEKWCDDMHRNLPADYIEGEVIDGG